MTKERKAIERYCMWDCRHTHLADKEARREQVKDCPYKRCELWEVRPR